MDLSNYNVTPLDPNEDSASLEECPQTYVVDASQVSFVAPINLSPNQAQPTWGIPSSTWRRARVYLDGKGVVFEDEQ